MSVLADTSQSYWYASRAAGTSAMALASVSVAYGLLAAGKLLPKRLPHARVLHEGLSLATLAAIAVHGLVLLGDGYLHPSLADILIPFASAYERWWQALHPRRLRARAPRPVLLRPRPHRRRAMARHPLPHGPGLARDPGPQPGRGHRRRPLVVPDAGPRPGDAGPGRAGAAATREHATPAADQAGRSGRTAV